MAADGSVIIDTRMDTTGVQNGVSAIKQSFNGLGSAATLISVGLSLKEEKTSSSLLVNVNVKIPSSILVLITFAI